METEFELQRGVRAVELHEGFAQVAVVLKGDLADARIAILGVLAEAGVSHKYLKLTQDGLGFVINGDQVESCRDALLKVNADFEIDEGRSLVLVRGVGMREEPGMLAQILRSALSSGLAPDHIGDMHDKMFLVAESEVANKIAQSFKPEGLSS